MTRNCANFITLPQNPELQSVREAAVLKFALELRQGPAGSAVDVELPKLNRERNSFTIPEISAGTRGISDRSLANDANGTSVGLDEWALERVAVTLDE